MPTWSEYKNNSIKMNDYQTFDKQHIDYKNACVKLIKEIISHPDFVKIKNFIDNQSNDFFSQGCMDLLSFDHEVYNIVKKIVFREDYGSTGLYILYDVTNYIRKLDFFN